MLVFLVIVGANIVQAFASTGPPPFVGQGDPVRFSFNPRLWHWSMDEWGLSPVSLRGRWGAQKPGVAPIDADRRSGPFPDAPTVRVVDTRRLMLALEGPPTGLAYDQATDRFLLTTTRGLYITDGALQRIIRYAIVDPEFSVDLGDLTAGAFLDSHTVMALSENKSFVVLRENERADPARNEPRFLASSGGVEEVTRGRLTTVRARMMYVMSLAFDPDAKALYTLTVPNARTRQLVVSQFDRTDFTLSAEFLPTTAPSVTWSARRHPLDDLYVSAATWANGRLYALSAAHNVLLVADVLRHSIVEVSGIDAPSGECGAPGSSQDVDSCARWDWPVCWDTPPGSCRRVRPCRLAVLRRRQWARIACSHRRQRLPRVACDGNADEPASSDDTRAIEVVPWSWRSWPVCHLVLQGGHDHHLYRLPASASAGVYGSAYRLYEIGLLVPTAVMSAAIPVAVSLRHRDPDEYGTYAGSVMQTLLTAGVLFAILGAALSRYAVDVVFGPAFGAAAFVFILLLPGLVARYVSVWLGTLLISFGRRKEFLRIAMVTSLVAIGSYWALIPVLGVPGAAGLTSLVEVGVTAATWSVLGEARPGLPWTVRWIPVIGLIGWGAGAAVSLLPLASMWRFVAGGGLRTMCAAGRVAVLLHTQSDLARGGGVPDWLGETSPCSFRHAIVLRFSTRFSRPTCRTAWPRSSSSTTHRRTIRSRSRVVGGEGLARRGGAQ